MLRNLYPARYNRALFALMQRARPGSGKLSADAAGSRMACKFVVEHAPDFVRPLPAGGDPARLCCRGRGCSTPTGAGAGRPHHLERAAHFARRTIDLGQKPSEFLSKRPPLETFGDYPAFVELRKATPGKRSNVETPRLIDPLADRLESAGFIGWAYFTSAGGSSSGIA